MCVPIGSKACNLKHHRAASQHSHGAVYGVFNLAQQLNQSQFKFSKSESFSAEQSISGPISILLGERGRSFGQGLVVTGVTASL